MRGNAWLIEPSKFAERWLLIAWKCAELRLPIAWKCAELRPANAWKCAEPRLAWECELRGRLRTAARVRGTRVGSAREVRLKCGSSASDRGSAHWLVPYSYGTGTLRVKKHSRSVIFHCVHLYAGMISMPDNDMYPTHLIQHVRIFLYELLRYLKLIYRIWYYNSIFISVLCFVHYYDFESS